MSTELKIEHNGIEYGITVKSYYAGSEQTQWSEAENEEISYTIQTITCDESFFLSDLFAGEIEMDEAVIEAYKKTLEQH